MTNPDHPRRRRRASLWTLLAPAALVLFVIALYNTVDDYRTQRTSTAAATTGTVPGAGGVGGAPKQKFYKVKDGDAWLTIAAKFNYTGDQLKACNPQIKDTTTLAVGTRVRVRCPEQSAADEG